MNGDDSSEAMKRATERDVLGPSKVGGCGTATPARGNAGPGAVYPDAQRLEPLDRAYQVPLRERVQHRLQGIHEQGERLLRINQLLTEHPEFEQFLELQQLLNRTGL